MNDQQAENIELQYAAQTTEHLEERVDERTSLLQHAVAQLLRELTRCEKREKERRRNEEWLRLTQFSLDYAPDAVFWVDLNGSFIYVNDTACRYLGYTRRELLGMHIPEIDPTFSAEVWHTQYSQLEQQGAVTFETTHQRKDGSLFPVEITATFLRYHHYEYICSFVRDITERKQLQKALAEREERFRLLAENAPDIIYRYRLAPFAGYEYISPSCERITGYSPDEYYANPDMAMQILHPDNQFLRNVIRETPGNFTEPMVLHCLHRNGTEIWLEQRNTVVYDEDGTPIAVEGIARDVTEQKQMETELQETNRQLKHEIAARAWAEQVAMLKADELARSNEELEHFAYIASHDLQEPLRMVSSYVQLLAEEYHDKLDDDARDYINYAVDGSLRMKNLINDLLQYSRVGTKGKPMVATDSGDILNRVIASLHMTLEETGGMVSYDPLPVVMADEMQLERLFLNLIGNAIKFAGDHPPVVHIWASPDKDDMWQFAVQDNGIGIEPQYAERVFQIFQRLHSRGDYAGTGIGLAICKKIVERHGGTIWIESQPDNGTTFFFTLKGETAR